MKSWRRPTVKQYNVYLDKYVRFCIRKDLDPLDHDVNKCLLFLNYMYNKKYSYSAINTARSALSCIFDSPPIGDNILIKRFLRAVFNERPNLPKYSRTWDVSIVLKHLESCSPGKCLNLLQLSQKLATLIALTTGQRAQTLKALNIDHAEFSATSVKFHITTLLKHNTQQNKSITKVTLVAYPNNKKLCAVTYLKQYIERTKPLRKDNILFIGSHKPHKPVSSSTISRWIKSTLHKAGIDTTYYSGHSTRAASTSAAAASNEVDLNTIMKAASWVRASTFATYYKKEVHDTSLDFARAVLHQAK